MADTRILLLSGSTRRGSGNTAALRTVQATAPEGITAEMYQGLAALPAFSPDEDEKPPGPAADLRARIAAADGLRSEEHTSELQSRRDLVCRLLLEKKT